MNKKYLLGFTKQIFLNLLHTFPTKLINNFFLTLYGLHIQMIQKGNYSSMQIYWSYNIWQKLNNFSKINVFFSFYRHAYYKRCKLTCWISDLGYLLEPSGYDVIARYDLIKNEHNFGKRCLWVKNSLIKHQKN